MSEELEKKVDALLEEVNRRKPVEEMDSIAELEAEIKRCFGRVPFPSEADVERGTAARKRIEAIRERCEVKEKERLQELSDREQDLKGIEEMIEDPLETSTTKTKLREKKKLLQQRIKELKEMKVEPS
jgi:hypothetical protein